MEAFVDDPFFNGEATTIWNVSTTTTTTPFLLVNGTARPYWKGVLETATTIITTFNLILLMTGMGAATYLREIWSNLKKPWGSLIGMVCQFGILPAVGFGLALVFELPHYQALGLLILCCSPGGAFSNFFAYWLDGDIALSLLMTATSSLIAFGGMPLNMWLYSHHWVNEKVKIPYTNILISMAFATGPALLGMLIRHKTRIWASRITKICSVLGWIGAITAGLFIVIIYWETMFTATWRLGFAAAAVPFVGFCLAFLLSKIFCFNNSICRTIGIETGCQNIVIAMNVMLLSFPDPEIRSEMVLFPMVYGLAQLLEVLIFICIFRCYKFAHRHDVTEETVKSVIDDTVLMKVPSLVAARINEREELMRTDPDLIYSNGQWRCNNKENSANRFSREQEDATAPQQTGNRALSCPSNDETKQELLENPLFMRQHSQRNYSLTREDERHSNRDSGSYNSSLPDQLRIITEGKINSKKDLHSEGLPSLLCANCQNPINGAEVTRNMREINRTKLFRDGSFRNSPPRSPSMNAGYGFPTFRENNDDY